MLNSMPRHHGHFGWNHRQIGWFADHWVNVVNVVETQFFDLVRNPLMFDFQLLQFDPQLLDFFFRVDEITPSLNGSKSDGQQNSKSGAGIEPALKHLACLYPLGYPDVCPGFWLWASRFRSLRSRRSRFWLVDAVTAGPSGICCHWFCCSQLLFQYAPNVVLRFADLLQNLFLLPGFRYRVLVRRGQSLK